MILYDVEIVRAIPTNGVPREEGVAYCHNWQDYSNMGISVIVAYDSAMREYHVFLHDNLNEFQTLVAGKMIVGFNSVSFDDRVCAAHGLVVKTNYDVLRSIYSAKGLDPFPQYYSEAYRGYSLDAVSMATFGVGKSEQGALVPMLWQKGEWGRVINYCLRDVRLLVALMSRICAGDGIIDPVTKEPLAMNPPMETTL